MKRRFQHFFALLLTLAALSATCGAEARAEDIRRFSIGTAGTAGALYPMGIAMAESISRHVPGLAATGESTAASVQNIRNLTQGKLAMGVAQAEIATLAYLGEGDYAGRPAKDLRAMFSTIFSYVQCFTRADSGLKSYADLKGRAVGVGVAGSGGEMAARMVLKFYGLDYNALRPQFMPETEAATALKDGRIDAFIATHPLRSGIFLDLAGATPIRLIGVSEPEFYAAYPFYAPYPVPAGTYPGVDAEVVVPHSRVLMLTSTGSGLGDDDVYAIMRAIWDHPEEWNEVHAAVKAQVKWEDALAGVSIPLAPGAARYFEERGVSVPDGLKEAAQVSDPARAPAK